MLSDDRSLVERLKRTKGLQGGRLAHEVRAHCFVIFSSSMFSIVIYNRQKMHFQVLSCETEGEMMPRDHVCGARLTNS